MKRTGGNLSDLEKLLQATHKRRERIQAADESLSKPVKAPNPAPAPSAAPVPAKEAPVSTSMPTEPKEVAPVFSLAAAPRVIAPLDAAIIMEYDPLVAVFSGQEVGAPSVCELLHGGWVHAHYVHRTCPPAVARWLWEIACDHRRFQTTSAAARTLGALIDGAAFSASPWVPTPSDFLDALRRHGAELAQLAPRAKMSAGATVSAAGRAGDSLAAQAGTGAGETEGFDDPRQNLLSTLELLPPCARRWSAECSAESRLEASLWILRLMIEPHAAASFVHLQEAFAATLDGATENVWSSEWLPSVLARLRDLSAGLSHTAIVRMHDFLPPTLRAATVQRRASVDAIRLLVRRRARQHRAECKVEREARAEHRRADREAWEAARGAVEQGWSGEDDDEEEEKDAAEGEEVESEAAAGGDSPAARTLVGALESLDETLYRGRMDMLLSILMLTNVAIAAEPEFMRADCDALEQLKRRLGKLKQRSARYRGAIDYHGLECESMASYLSNKIELLFLAAPES